MYKQTMALTMIAVPGTILAQAGGDTVLKPAEMEKLFPASVYYHGQTATTQLRNSGREKFVNGSYVLAALVDTSGYSTAVTSKYQAYFVTDVPLKDGGENLPLAPIPSGLSPITSLSFAMWAAMMYLRWPRERIQT
jgi:hypothetical protein